MIDGDAAFLKEYLPEIYKAIGGDAYKDRLKVSVDPNSAYNTESLQMAIIAIDLYKNGKISIADYQGIYARNIALGIPGMEALPNPEVVKKEYQSKEDYDLEQGRKRAELEQAADIEKKKQIAISKATTGGVKTAWQGFFANKPKATINEIIAFKKSIDEGTKDSDFIQGYQQYIKVPGQEKTTMDQYRRIWEKPAKESMSEADLTKKALGGDNEAVGILDAMQKRRVEVAKSTGEAVVEARIGAVDVPGVARSIIMGKETIDNVKNTFGVPVQEAVRKEVLSLDPNYNFNKPRVRLAAVKSSLTLQYKQRGMMGSFVKNLNKQLGRVDNVMKDVIKRVGFRALDLPLRELNTRFKGSGHEKVLEAYLIEISNEIGKLSTGSAASIRELSTDAQEQWAKIHDPNLSFNELKKILDETQTMGNMRLESTNEEINETMSILDNIRKDPYQAKEQKGKFKIIKVEP